MRELAGHDALVTGGTRGVGLALALGLARAGMHTTLTHRWGSADEDALRRRFEDLDAPPPTIVESDAGHAGDRHALVEGLSRCPRVLVSNVCVAARAGALSRREWQRALRYSVEPLDRLLELCEDRFHALPEVIIASSSDGPDHYYPGYDYVALSKAALEARIARLAGTLPAGHVAFALRARQVDTASLERFFPTALLHRHRRFAVREDELATAARLLAGGAFDGASGQTLSLDHGTRTVDNLVALAPYMEAR